MSQVRVETYEIEDASSEASAMANDAAAQELIEKLGLAGQARLMNKETVTRVPYRAMEAAEMLVYKALCDGDAKLEDYSADSIPVRVLQVAAHAKECGMFQQLQVWYPSEARIDGPVLVGIIKTHQYPDHPEKWMRDLAADKFYILARWGKTLLPFEQLEAQAVKLCRNRRMNEIKKAMTELKMALASAEETNDLSELSRRVTASI